MLARFTIALPTVLFVGCVEVPQEALQQGPGGPGGPAAPMAGPGPEGGQGPGGAPPPPQGAQRQQPAGFEVEEGKGVAISGTVVYEGDAEGVLRVDFLPPKPAQGMPGAVHSITLEQPGAWSVDAPADFGELIICAFIDSNDDGPSRGEPKVLLTEPLKVGAEPIAEVELVIQDDWDRSHQQGNPKQMPPELRGQGMDPPQGGPGPDGGQPPQAEPPPAEATQGEAPTE
jgi:hypothetical protein